MVVLPGSKHLTFLEEIRIEKGIKQCCPLSPIIFTLALEPVLQSAMTLKNECGIPLCGHSVSALAYADNTVLLEKDKRLLDELLSAVGEAATWAGLTFKPAKCATLHVKSLSTLATQFTLQGGQPAILGEEDTYLHLCVLTGFRVPQMPTEANAA